MPNQKPVLTIDFDDVVVPFNLQFSIWHNEQYGTNVQYSDIYSYDMATIYGTDDTTIKKRVMRFSHQYHHRLQPLEGVRAHLTILSERYRLVLVTSRCESIREITLGWKAEHVPGLFSEAHFGNGFSLKHASRRRSKASMCREVGAVAHVDDAISHATDVAGDLGIPVFLPDRPWNQQFVSEPIIRVTDWEDITYRLLA